MHTTFKLQCNNFGRFKRWECFPYDTTFPGDTRSRASQCRQGVAGSQGSLCLVMSFVFKGSTRLGDPVFRSEYLAVGFPFFETLSVFETLGSCHSLECVMHILVAW